MSRQRSDVDPRLVAWLDEGPRHGPEGLRSRAFAQARSTRQDRVWLGRIPQPTRFQMMSASITLTAVAVLALAAGVALTPDTPEVAAPAPSASPSPATSPSPLHQGLLTPGEYTVAPFGGAEWAPCGPSEEPCPEAATDDDIRFTFTVPEGWAGAPFGSDIWLASYANSGPNGAGFLIGRGGWLYSDPCAESGDTDIPVGPTVDDFVDALVAHPTLDLSEPVGVTLDGYPGRYLELEGPADRADCPTFQAWAPTFYAQGDSNHQPIWVIDVDGVRVVIHGSEFPDTAPERSAELREIVESMRIEHDPALAPSPTPLTEDATAVVNGWPGARSEPAGLYSWTPGGRGWMHKGVEGSGSVELSFQVFDAEPGAGPVAEIGELGSDLDGTYTKQPQLVADVRLQSWMMGMGDQRILLIVKSYRDTAPAMIAEAEAVIESIRAEPTQSDAGYRLVFELEDGWDSG
jgi:hypothetical protein